ncbi:ParB/RepB/Spo0J family partition protein [Brunnivagina elsteri]|uniref:Chromosome partitioning protein ParB n=1 Tax=Brunnivagina elsteri CCALA 953 TaxID=987040 RepID=A0A2A2TPT4_9CYAN|nr:ParB/RepB/Spo0J family partition protein [Calothrix elsteri]PAX60531.1 chromosome partitioning protein ParB [Calothrix elsteri CCALA 953]
MAKALPTISTKFKGAVQKSDQEKKISELQIEIEQLRSASAPELEAEIEKLRSQLEATSGEVEIDVVLIDPNPNQPRQTITNASIQAKARSLKKYGQIAPVILVQQENGRYTLLDGQLRWEGAKVLGWEKLRAVVVPAPQDLDQSSLLTFLGFEDLNPLDKAEAIIKEITKITGFEVEEISTILATVLKRIERDGKIKELTKLVTVSAEEQKNGLEAFSVTNNEQDILLTLLELGLNPASVKANLMPMLFLPQDLKDAIRIGLACPEELNSNHSLREYHTLKGAHALALSVLSAKVLGIEDKVAAQERIKATDEVLKNNLTVPETRALINQIKAKYLTETKTESKEIKFAIAKISTLSDASLAEASNEQLAQLKELLTTKLADIEKFIH